MPSARASVPTEETDMIPPKEMGDVLRIDADVSDDMPGGSERDAVPRSENATRSAYRYPAISNRHLLEIWLCHATSRSRSGIARRSATTGANHSTVSAPSVQRP